ncbi:MAG: zinc ribbon domain-containing protein [Nitrospinaceae bacterium]|nr:zinc ribbon domain-containing protein [Nitrospinaceae bacterium]NIR55929.1 zinc ribbon domain-containing protein [Nitrospinaceae bacterium]NIS86380.1 zinc ribbon domain-containing protein [Nitrospinaceae bacterium]NIT83209.1 zinc ribbon domain-containing protein [Nitrospinaceae bacterium]NIU45423.1 zinc ribbon domain-containing protein [Nitrospinaceae bacterium]
MPIYEYECEKCGTVFELIHAVSAPPPKKCEAKGCKGKPRRMVSAGGFILKGDGWYATDYPSESRKKGWESETDSAATPPAGGKAESAPAAPSGAETKAPAASSPPAKKESPITKAMNKNPYSGGREKSTKNKKPSKS